MGRLTKKNEAVWWSEGMKKPDFQPKFKKKKKEFSYLRPKNEGKNRNFEIFDEKIQFFVEF